MTYQQFKTEVHILEVLFQMNRTAENSRKYHDFCLNNKRHANRYLKEKYSAA